MIVGTVDSDGVPIVMLAVAGSAWRAIIDTGFNADLELPLKLKGLFPAYFVGQIESLLAGGQRVVEDGYIVDFPFDDKIVKAGATFVQSDEILIGTHLIRSYRLEIDFPGRTVALKPSEDSRA